MHLLHLLPGEGHTAGPVRRPVGPQHRADGERPRVGGAVHGEVRLRGSVAEARGPAFGVH